MCVCVCVCVKIRPHSKATRTFNKCMTINHIVYEKRKRKGSMKKPDSVLLSLVITVLTVAWFHSFLANIL